MSMLWYYYTSGIPMGKTYVDQGFSQRWLAKRHSFPKWDVLYAVMER